jgi:hypothetical protein
MEGVAHICWKFWLYPGNGEYFPQFMVKKLQKENNKLNYQQKNLIQKALRT